MNLKCSLGRRGSRDLAPAPDWLCVNASHAVSSMSRWSASGPATWTRWPREFFYLTVNADQTFVASWASTGQWTDHARERQATYQMTPRRSSTMQLYAGDAKPTIMQDTWQAFRAIVTKRSSAVGSASCARGSRAEVASGRRLQAVHDRYVPTSEIEPEGLETDVDHGNLAPEKADDAIPRTGCQRALAGRCRARLSSPRRCRHGS